MELKTGTQNVILKVIVNIHENEASWGNLQVNTTTYHPKIKYFTTNPNPKIQKILNS